MQQVHFVFVAIVLLTTSFAACGANSSDCDAEQIRNNYPTCTQADNLLSCTSACGEWTKVGLARVESCLCSTLEQEKSCTSDDDCTVKCIAEDKNQCSDVTEAHCAPNNILSGCHCIVDDNGEWSRLCVD